MKKTLCIFICLFALAVSAANYVTNYVVVTNFDATTWFLLSVPSLGTNYNLPGNYVASTADLNAASNAIVLQFPPTTNFVSMAQVRYSLITNTASQSFGGAGSFGGSGTFRGAIASPLYKITMTTNAPTPASLGTNGSAFWVSNTLHLFWSYTTNGVSSNAAVLLH